MTEQEQESGERPRSRRDSRLEVDARVVPSPEPLSLPSPTLPSLYPSGRCAGDKSSARALSGCASWPVWREAGPAWPRGREADDSDERCVALLQPAPHTGHGKLMSRQRPSCTRNILRRERKKKGKR